MATGAFQNLGQAIDAIRKYLELPPLDGSFSSRAPRREAPASNVFNVVTPHAMLKALLTQETLDLLEKVLKDHAELRRASGKVRTATSTYMKSGPAAFYCMFGSAKVGSVRSSHVDLSYESFVLRQGQKQDRSDSFVRNGAAQDYS